MKPCRTPVALLTCVQPFGQWNAIHRGGKEFRGIRTLRYTYAKDLEGPWLLFDNEVDPYQLNNLVGTSKGKETPGAIGSNFCLQNFGRQKTSFFLGWSM